MLHLDGATRDQMLVDDHKLDDHKLDDHAQDTYSVSQSIGFQCISQRGDSLNEGVYSNLPGDGQRMTSKGHSRAGCEGCPSTPPSSSSVPKGTLGYEAESPPTGVKRKAHRRAVVVGVNYLCTPDVLLRGACNDACSFACALVMMWGFHPSDIILLIDCYPASEYSTSEESTASPVLTEACQEQQHPGNFVFCNSRQPTRRNILLALNWLRHEAQSGDLLFFYFAGHGIQLDDMSGWEGEGYDEAILPMDFYGEEVNGITAVMLRNVLLCVPKDVQVTVILDCNGGQTLLDPAGTGTWSFIKGVKQRGVWPFVTDATDKVSRASYDSELWLHPSMRRFEALPRFIPPVDVSSVNDLVDPILQKINMQPATRAKGYLFSSAPWGQCALEVCIFPILFPVIQCDGTVLVRQQADASSTPPSLVFHGVFTWCFLHALTEVTKTPCTDGMKHVTFDTLLKCLQFYLQNSLKGTVFSQLGQKPELTFHRSGGCSLKDVFLWESKNNPLNDKGGIPWTMDPPPIDTYLSTWEAEEQLRFTADASQLKEREFPQHLPLTHLDDPRDFYLNDDRNYDFPSLVSKTPASFPHST